MTDTPRKDPRFSFKTILALYIMERADVDRFKWIVETVTGLGGVCGEGDTFQEALRNFVSDFSEPNYQEMLCFDEEEVEKACVPDAVFQCLVCGKKIENSIADHDGGKSWEDFLDEDSENAFLPNGAIHFVGIPGYGSKFDNMDIPGVTHFLVCDDCIESKKSRLFVHKR